MVVFGRVVFTFAPEKMECRYCRGKCIRKGHYKTTQRLLCKACGRYQQTNYSNTLCPPETGRYMIKLHNEGVSISGIARITGISKTHEVNKLRSLSKRCFFPLPSERNQDYELDELRTFIGNKRNECWVMYSINRVTRRVVHVVVGRRTKENLGKITDALSSLAPKRIFTDGLNIYQSLIDKTIHRTKPYLINHIERMNLTLRTHLKRLSRRTICFSRSQAMLEAGVRLYFGRRIA